MLGEERDERQGKEARKGLGSPADPGYLHTSGLLASLSLTALNCSLRYLSSRLQESLQAATAASPGTSFYRQKLRPAPNLLCRIPR